MNNSNHPFATLRRLARPQYQPAAKETCELCSQALAVQHRHLLELPSRKIICACDACALRFQDVAGGRFKLIPRESRSLPEFQIEDSLWDDLALPINLVFVFARSDTRRIGAAYPGPAGATESMLSAENWQALSAQNPQLNDLQPDVEALLINRVGTARDYFIAPIDRCFELTGLIRKYWHGLSGGDHVWTEIDRFFSILREQAGLETPERAAAQEAYA